MIHRALLFATILIVAAFDARAYSLSTSKWTTSTVAMHLQLGAGSGVLLDGSPSWGAAAENALFTWNSYISASNFSVVRDSTASRAAGNRLNNVYFSPDVNGQAWGTGVLAVTISYASGATRVETDVLFNQGLAWNSYRGPQRMSASGAPLYDFHRVALHEFGHALGLNHPDEAGQTVAALMNSRISALDALTADDIAGGRALYGSTSVGETPPTITAHPVSRSVLVGQSATFTVSASSTTALSYQWLKSGAPLPGATNASFSIASATLADAGSYAVAVSNSAGTVTSAAATLTVTVPVQPPPPSPPPPPSTPSGTALAILVAPVSQSANAGSTVAFYVVANGTAPLSYQWFKDGAALPGATNSSLSLANVQPAHAGSYRVTVANPAGSVTSAPASLTVHTPPVITTQPADQTIPIGSRLRLAVVANASSTLSYAWRKDGAPLPGANSPVYEVAAADPSHSGSYAVVVTGAAGAVTSATVRVTVVAAPPTIATAPVAQAAVLGDRVTFSVVPAGTPPFAYQWFKDTVALPGATAATFSLPSVRAADAGGYSVRISNAAGSITTPPALLTVRSSRLVNLSTRAFVPAGGALTPGFFIRGSGSKSLVIRAVGPTLRSFGIETAVPETRLEVIAQGESAASTEDAGFPVATAAATASVGAFPLEPGGRDAAVQASLAPRSYTVRVSPGNASMSGIALAEIYDASPLDPASQLGNVSTLGFVGAGENGLTAGFVISGNAPKRLLIRAVGPGLAPFEVADALPDPQLALIRQGESAPTATNDNWSDGPAMQDAFRVAGAFALPAGSNDAALVVTLEPGAYTVTVSSVTAAITGQALLELYDLDP